MSIKSYIPHPTEDPKLHLPKLVFFKKQTDYGLHLADLNVVQKGRAHIKDLDFKKTFSLWLLYSI